MHNVAHKDAHEAHKQALDGRGKGTFKTTRSRWRISCESCSCSESQNKERDSPGDETRTSFPNGARAATNESSRFHESVAVLLKYEVRRVEPSKWIWILLAGDANRTISADRFPTRGLAVAACIEKSTTTVRRARPLLCAEDGPGPCLCTACKSRN